VDFDHRVLVCKRCSQQASHRDCAIKPLKSSFPPHKLKVVNYIITAAGAASAAPGPQGHYSHMESDTRHLLPSVLPGHDRVTRASDAPSAGPPFEFDDDLQHGRSVT
jgi:hypothetical protein